MTHSATTPAAGGEDTWNVLRDARLWVEHSIIALRPLSPAACAPGEAMLKRIDAALSALSPAAGATGVVLTSYLYQNTPISGALAVAPEAPTPVTSAPGAEGGDDLAGLDLEPGTPGRLIQRLEDASSGGLYICDADREEAVQIATEEMTRAWGRLKMCPEEGSNEHLCAFPSCTCAHKRLPYPGPAAPTPAPVAQGEPVAWQGCDPNEPYDPLKCAIWAALVPFQHELLQTGGVTFMGLRNAIVEAVRSFAIASQRDALAPAAPRSASAATVEGIADLLSDVKCRLVALAVANGPEGAEPDELLARVEAALLDAPRPGETGDGWEPIETAPTDRPIAVRMPSKLLPSGWFVTTAWVPDPDDGDNRLSGCSTIYNYNGEPLLTRFRGSWTHWRNDAPPAGGEDRGGET